MDIGNRLTKPQRTQTDQTARPRLSAQVSARTWLVAIMLAAIALRLASAIYQGDAATDLPGIYDQISYDALAQRVVEGYGFSFATGWWPATRAGEPTAHWSFLYTLYLAGVYILFGVHPLVARLLQALVAGVLHTWLVWRIGRRIFGPAVGLIAAGLSAVYIYFFYYAGALITETFYIIGILWTFDVTLRLAEKAGHAQMSGDSRVQWRLWLELGLAIGVTVLLRQLFLLFVPFLFLWLWWTAARRQPAASYRPRLHRLVRWPTVRGLLGTTLVVMLMILPWTVRNYRAFHTLVPLNTNAGYAFFWGNHPIYGTHFVDILPATGPGYYDLIPKELLPLNEAELDRALLKEGIGFVVDDPVRFVLLSLSRAGEYFKFWPSSQSGTVSNLSRVGSFGILLPFMLYGLWISATRVRSPGSREQRSAIILLASFAIIYSTIHLLSWALVRYRLPVDAVLLIFAAIGLEDVAGRLGLLSRATRPISHQGVV